MNDDDVLWLYGHDDLWSRAYFYLGLALVLGGLWFASDAIDLSPPPRGRGDMRALAQVVGLGTHGRVVDDGQLLIGRSVAVLGVVQLVVLPFVLGPVLSRLWTARRQTGRHAS